MRTIRDLRIIYFPSFEAEGAPLVVFSEKGGVPFDIQRVFTVNASVKSNRGRHAHKKCNQLMIVLSGKCVIRCNDGTSEKVFLLAKSSEGLYVPATIWAEEEYEANTILMVLTDQPYDENDYIRDYETYLAFRRM